MLLARTGLVTLLIRRLLLLFDFGIDNRLRLLLDLHDIGDMGGAPIGDLKLALPTLRLWLSIVDLLLLCKPLMFNDDSKLPC